MNKKRLIGYLFVMPEFFRNLIVIGEADYLCDFKLKLITEFMEELLGGKGICTVAICNELKVLRQFF